MAHRLFKDNGEWTHLASRTCNEITHILEDVLQLLEERAEGPIDLKDFHFVANRAIGGFVADLSIRRRMGEGNEPPMKIMENYPRLKNNLPSLTNEVTIIEEVDDD